MTAGIAVGGLPGLANRVALVTGAAQGIGAAVAEGLGAHGAVVAAVDRNHARLTAAVRRLTGKGYDVHAYPADVSDGSAVELLGKRVETTLGPLGILVNVAGIMRPGPVTDLSDEDWSATFAVNTDGVFYLSRFAARSMLKRRAGVIITVGSNAAEVPRIGMAAYAASKAAATQFTKTLGLELAAHNVRCNIVSPGSTDTAMQRALWSRHHDRTRVIEGDPTNFRTGIPLGRLAEPSDIAWAVAFLASEHARHITMQNLYVDGGASLR